MGYAVVDVETTGFRRSDRVVEVAVVQLDRDRRVTGEWCTLLNPGRDLGPQHVHRIRAADVWGAPTFALAAGALARRLAGRVLVAHNLAFDARFLAAEFGRVGVDADFDGLCTMRLSGGRRSLRDCCADAGVPLLDAHSALADAHAAAALFARLPEVPGAGALDLPPLGADVPEVRRGAADLAGGVLAGTAGAGPAGMAPAGTAPAGGVPASGLLAGAAPRSGALAGATRPVELSGGTLAGGTRAGGTRSGEVLAGGALAGGSLGGPAIGVAATGVPGAGGPAAGGAGSAVRLARGDLVVFTGQMDDARDVWVGRALGSGLRVNSGYVTRATALLVAADPFSLSTKARRARAYGVPIVSEGAFAALLAGLADGLPDEPLGKIS
ncbi:exonuclease domain-containing protein [Actinosynnema mirum]|uniref:Exonuclease RNase T and DNA polymerase III n=1 Tax=Actinosynnema mirum (strain ATCC 29888 / DSM 43827 / JCM 3225 / NBRC 14064 / NCIMB 13271 / NRRL B-12336 / IMRU 3971 / 101) TaxID=446462 RepID=C6WSG9_ACTMD|nr:exonuclease domain-containing protein [Actinosynnema mirum]ACU40839.1 Exonuclease RNase T and DNA polymerase III [Actinosynnema mirum DSM 43827]